MDTITEEKLYRIARKKDSHVNTKLNPDGSKAAIQFTNDGNTLNGPLNLIEVDENELISTEYVLTESKPRTFKEIVWQELVAPTVRELLYQAMMEGYDNLCNQIKAKAVPALKAKSQNFVQNVGIITSGIKDGLTGKTPKASKAVNNYTIVAPNFQSSIVKSQEKTVRSKEEVENIVQAMRLSALTLAACIRMLNNTVMADDGTNPQLRLEIQRNIQALSTSGIMRQIDLLLEDKNRALLDEAELAMLSFFKEGYFVANDSRVPITRYLNE